MRLPTLIIGVVFLASLPLGAPAAADELRPIERSSAKVAAGDLVTVSSKVPCEEPTGERHLFAVVGLHRADHPSGAALAGAAVDSEGVLPTQFPGRLPDYTPDTNDGGGFNADGSWTAKMFVPYGTPAGTYRVRADCRADYLMEPDTEILFEYTPTSLTVLPWPEVPPVRRDVTPWGISVDGEGTVHPWGHVPSTGFAPEREPLWPGRDVVRGVASVRASYAMFEARVGVLVDAHGGLRGFDATGTSLDPWPLLGEVHGATYWPAWDIARGVALTAPTFDGSPVRVSASGVVVDGWGGLHPFGIGTGRVPTVTPGTGPYWKGWDIARDVVINPDGRGGYVLDAWGGLHGFGLDGNPAPPTPAWNPYWKGWDIARAVVTVDLPEGGAGYVIDAWGGMHPYSVNRAFLLPAVPGPYWVGRDVVRGAVAVSAFTWR